MITKAGFTWCIEYGFIDDFFIFNSFDILDILLMGGEWYIYLMISITLVDNILL
jgi:hypothetical protein